MSESLPTLYEVVYSGRVRRRIVEMAGETARRGDSEAFAASLKEFHHRLCVYPQFGDPLTDLTVEPSQIRIGTVPPLVMRYGLYEERRLVLVVALPELLPMSAG